MGPCPELFGRLAVPIVAAVVVVWAAVDVLTAHAEAHPGLPREACSEEIKWLGALVCVAIGVCRACATSPVGAGAVDTAPRGVRITVVVVIAEVTAVAAAEAESALAVSWVACEGVLVANFVMRQPLPQSPPLMAVMQRCVITSAPSWVLASPPLGSLRLSCTRGRSYRARRARSRRSGEVAADTLPLRAGGAVDEAIAVGEWSVVILNSRPARPVWLLTSSLVMLHFMNRR